MIASGFNVMHEKQSWKAILPMLGKMDAFWEYLRLPEEEYEARKKEGIVLFGRIYMYSYLGGIYMNSFTLVDMDMTPTKLGHEKGTRGCPPNWIFFCKKGIIHKYSMKDEEGKRSSERIIDFLQTAVEAKSESNAKKNVALVTRSGQAPLSHYYGWYCRWVCFNQVVLRFYLEVLARLPLHKNTMHNDDLPPYPIGIGMPLEFQSQAYVAWTMGEIYERTKCLPLRAKTLSERMACVRELFGNAGNENAPTERKQLASNMTTRVCDRNTRFVWSNAKEHHCEPGKESPIFWNATVALLSGNYVFDLTVRTNNEFAYKFPSDAMNHQVRPRAFLRMVSAIAKEEIPNLPRSKDQTFCGKKMEQYTPATPNLFAAHARGSHVSRGSDNTDGADGVASLLGPKLLEYEDGKEVTASFLHRLKDHTLYYVYKEDNERARNFRWDIQCSFVQGRFDCDQTIITAPHQLLTPPQYRHIMKKGGGGVHFVVPLSEFSLALRVYYNGDSRKKSKLLIVRRGQLLATPLGAIHEFGYLLDMEGSPFLLVTMVAVPGDEEVGIKEYHRHYPHLAATCDGHWVDTGSDLDLRLEPLFEQRLHLTETRTYVPSNNFKTGNEKVEYREGCQNHLQEAFDASDVKCLRRNFCF